MRRITGIAFGLGNHALFALTVWKLFAFLKGTPSLASMDASLSINFLLAAIFVVPHSVLLLPTVRKKLTHLIPDAFYGSVFCVVTCASLLIVFSGWQSSPLIIWQFSGPSRWIIQAAFYGSWVMLFYSLSLTGLGYQTGWTPWWHWVRRRPLAARRFNPRGAYLLLRHPVYLSFLGLIWFTPVMTSDRAVLTGVWTTYIFVGSWLKDQRLSYYLGSRYAQYQAEVPGYPGMPLGPLARVPVESVGESSWPIGTRAEHQSSLRKAA